MTKDHAGLTHEHAALQARFKTMLNGHFINLHIRRDIEMAEKVLESIPAMLEQARAEGREEAAKELEARAAGFHEAARRQGKKVGALASGFIEAAKIIRFLSATRKGSPNPPPPDSENNP